MTETLGISATYSGFKLVTSRSVVQIILEAPIERAQSITDILGFPNPGEEKWVAVALLDMKKVEAPEEKPKRSQSPVQQAGMLCNQEGFQEWIKETVFPHLCYDEFQPPTNEETAKHAIYKYFNITSRTQLDPEEWAEFIAPYLTQTGQVAEDRS